MQKIIILLLLLCTPSVAEAIVNAEELALNLQDRDGWSGKVGLAANGSSGNSNKLMTEATLHLFFKQGRHLSMLASSYSYGKSQGVLNTRKSFAHLRHRYALRSQWDIEGFGQLQQDAFARLRLRSLLGGGGRYHWPLLSGQAAVGVGSFYEQERRTGSIQVRRLWRGNIYLTLQLPLNDRSKLQNTLYYQPAWQQPNNFRLLDNTIFSVLVSEHLDLKLSLEIAHDSQPPAAVLKTDISYKSGLVYHF